MSSRVLISESSQNILAVHVIQIVYCLTSIYRISCIDESPFIVLVFEENPRLQVQLQKLEYPKIGIVIQWRQSQYPTNEIWNPLRVLTIQENYN